MAEATTAQGWINDAPTPQKKKRRAIVVQMIAAQRYGQDGNPRWRRLEMAIALLDEELARNSFGRRTPLSFKNLYQQDIDNAALFADSYRWSVSCIIRSGW